MRIPFETMQERHLVYVYVGVWLVQLGYLAWIAQAWLRAGRSVASTDRPASQR